MSRSLTNELQTIADRIARGKPKRPPVANIIEWAEDNIIMPPDEPYPGAYRHRVPASMEILETLAHDDSVRSIAILGSVQTLKTTVLNVGALWKMANDPANIAIYQPVEGLRDKYVRNKFVPIANGVQAFDGYFQSETPTDSRRYNSDGHKIDFRYGGEQTGAAFASYAWIFVDEWRKFRVDMGAEIKGRQTVYESRGGAKSIFVGSAGFTGDCKISELYENSDKRVWEIPCPACDNYQTLVWKQVKWQGWDEASAHYVCQFCGFYIPPEQLQEIQIKGQWRPTIDKPNHKRLAGFHVNAMASTLVDLPTLVAEYMNAKTDARKMGTMQSTIAFYQERLAIPFNTKGMALDGKEIYDTHRRNYLHLNDMTVPDWVRAVTMAVDIQDDRLEVEIAGWAFEEVALDESPTVLGINGQPQRLKYDGKHCRLRRYGIRYFKIVGSTSIDPYVWATLDFIIKNAAFKVDGVTDANGNELFLPIAMTGIDCGDGNNSNTVMQYFHRLSSEGINHVIPLMGHSGDRSNSTIGKPAISLGLNKETTANFGRQYYNVGTWTIKDYVMASLRAGVRSGDKFSFEWAESVKPSGFWTQPEFANILENRDFHGYNLEYFAGLASEYKGVKVDPKTGQSRVRWHKSQQRNEPLDLAVYNHALINFAPVLQKLEEQSRFIDDAIATANKTD